MAVTHRTVYVASIPETVLLALALGVGAAVGALVARRAGGLRAVMALGLVFGSAAVLVVLDAIAREQRLRTSQCCVVVTVADIPLAAAAMFAPAFVGIALGAWLARVRAARPGTNALLEAAGAYALVGAVAALALSPYAWSVLAPFATVALEPAPHALALVAQVTLAAIVYVVRAPEPRLRAAGLFALMGFAGVAYADLLEIWFTLFLDHHYVPLSIVVVPVVSGALAAALIRVAQALGAGRPGAPHVV